MNRDKINKLLELGFNCMPINENKTPMQGWKKWQDEKLPNLNAFHRQSDHYALICGFNDVECIDIDLKILPSKQDRLKYMDEIFDMLDANLHDFNKRFVVKITRSNGFHVIYRADNIEGNQKLATLNGYDEALIETRGIGGYICMYDESKNLDYENITKITDEERDIVIGVCRTFNEKHDDIIEVDTKVITHYKYDDDTLTPWDDFNRKNTILDIVGDEFSIVKNKSDKILIRRHGAKTPHSGYIYKDSGCMYLFSTGTIYEHQRLISPFVAYAIRYHHGDFRKAASDIYSKGYGDRKKPVLKEEIRIIKSKKVDVLSFPKDIFPNEINHYMTECVRTLNNSIDYLGCSFIWLSSLVIGNTIRIEVKKGWQEISTLWMAIVGEAGIGKTPSTDSIIRPLDKINGEEKRRYQVQKEAYDEYKLLTKKEKQLTAEIQEPRRTQFIVDDVTIEALINLHSQNPNGVGVHKDELAGWFKDMNKYKEGSDKEQWLSSWSGKGISVDRITRQSDYIQKPLLPVLGGIQPTILVSFFNEENRDNGFLDRMLFSYPRLKVENYIDDEISSDLLDYYDNWVYMFHQEMRKITMFNDYGDIKPHIARWNGEAKKYWIKIFNEITEKQNSDDTPEFLKTSLPKMKSYIPRFALIINTINAVHEGLDLTVITKDSLIKAKMLADYFIAMNERMVSENSDLSETKTILNGHKGTKGEKLKALIKSGKDYNKSQVAKELGISRTMLYKYIKQFS